MSTLHTTSPLTAGQGGKAPAITELALSLGPNVAVFDGKRGDVVAAYDAFECEGCGYPAVVTLTRIDSETGETIWTAVVCQECQVEWPHHDHVERLYLDPKSADLDAATDYALTNMLSGLGTSADVTVVLAEIVQRLQTAKVAVTGADTWGPRWLTRWSGQSVLWFASSRDLELALDALDGALRLVRGEDAETAGIYFSKPNLLRIFRFLTWDARMALFGAFGVSSYTWRRHRGMFRLARRQAWIHLTQAFRRGHALGVLPSEMHAMIIGLRAAQRPGGDR